MQEQPNKDADDENAEREFLQEKLEYEEDMAHERQRRRKKYLLAVLGLLSMISSSIRFLNKQTLDWNDYLISGIVFLMFLYLVWVGGSAYRKVISRLRKKAGIVSIVIYSSYFSGLLCLTFMYVVIILYKTGPDRFLIPTNTVDPSQLMTWFLFSVDQMLRSAMLDLFESFHLRLSPIVHNNDFVTSLVIFLYRSTMEAIIIIPIVFLFSRIMKHAKIKC